MIRIRKNNKRKLNINKKYVAIFIIIILIVIVVPLIVLSAVKYRGKKSLMLDNKKIVNGKNISLSNISNVKGDDGGTYRIKDSTVNILVLGTDNDWEMSKEAGTDDMGQTDAIYIVSIDTDKKSLKIFAIPRDTMTDIEIYDDNYNLVATDYMQLAVQYSFGKNVNEASRLAAKTVSDFLCDIPINRVCVFNSAAIPTITDAVGGVEVTFYNDFTDESGEKIDPEFYKGNTVKLTGEQAEYFVRERDCSIQESAMDRLSRQEQYISKLFTVTKKKIKSNPLFAWQLVTNLKEKDCLYTDLSKDEIIYLASIVKKCGISMDDIITIPGNVEMGEEYEEYHTKYNDVAELVLDYFYVHNK